MNSRMPDGFTRVEINEAPYTRLVEFKFFRKISAEVRHGDGGTGQIGGSGQTGDTPGIHFHRHAGNLVESWSEPCRGNCVGDHERALNSNEFEVVPQRSKFNVHSVRDEAEPQVPSEMKETLQDVVMSW